MQISSIILALAAGAAAVPNGIQAVDNLKTSELLIKSQASDSTTSFRLKFTSSRTLQNVECSADFAYSVSPPTYCPGTPGFNGFSRSCTDDSNSSEWVWFFSPANTTDGDALVTVEGPDGKGGYATGSIPLPKSQFVCVENVSNVFNPGYNYSVALN